MLRTLNICSYCREELESIGEKFRVLEHEYTDEEDEKASRCELCDENGNDEIFVIRFK